MKYFFPLLLLTVTKPHHEKAHCEANIMDLFCNWQSFWDYVLLLSQKVKNDCAKIAQEVLASFWGFALHKHQSLVK